MYQKKRTCGIIILSDRFFTQERYYRIAWRKGIFHMNEEFKQFSPPWIKQLRFQMGYTQEQFARAIGASTITVSRWERGTEYPSARFQEKLLDVRKGQVEKRMPAPAGQLLFDPTIPFHSGLPTKGLIGREALFERSKRWLQSHTGAFVLQGAYGAGKTSLAVALVLDKEVQAFFPQGILWASLGQNPNIIGHLSRWGGMLGIPSREMARVSSLADWKRHFLGRMTGQRLLLVIDDIWDVEQARPLFVGGSQCAYLMTTHLEKQLDRLVQQENVFRVGELNSRYGVELLEEFIPDFVREKPEEARKLVEVVGGLPLSLTIMGKYLQWQEYGQHSEQIQQLLERLRVLGAQAQLTMLLNPSELFTNASPQLLSTIQMNIGQLDEETREDLFAILVFPAQPNTFSEEAVRQVSEVSLKSLDHLVKIGLLQRVGDRYSLDQAVINYASSNPQPEELLQHLQERMVEFFTAYSEKHASNYEALEIEADNMLVALTFAAQFVVKQESKVFLDIFIRGVNTLAPFLESRGMYVLVKERLLEVKKMARQLDERALMMILLHLGRIAELGSESEEMDEAVNYYESGLKIARKLGDEDKQTQLLLCLGEVCNNAGDDTKAEHYSLEGLRLMQGRAREEQRMALLLNNLGEIASTRGKIVESNTHYKQALQYARQAADWETAGSVLQNLGVNAERSGEYGQADAYYQEGLRYAERIGHKQRVSAIKMNMGMLEFKKNRYAKARQLYQESLELGKQIRHAVRISSVLQNLGMLERTLRNYNEAARYLRESLKVAYEINHAWLISETLCEWGSFYSDQGMGQLAQEAFERALQKAEEIESKVLIATALFGLAQAALLREDSAGIERFGRESQRLFQEMGNERYQEVTAWLQAQGL
jgi:tetratricopeptide (TPR) repeat protein/transcriptional regulator with XRE-family HTH domain